MRLLFTSDLHGNVPHYGRLIAAAGIAKPSIVVLGGDLLPDDNATHPETLGMGQPAFVRGAFRKFIGDLRQRAGVRDVLVIFGNHDWGSSTAAMKELADDSLVQVLTHTASTQVQGVNFTGYSYTPPTPWYVKDFERLDSPGDVPPLIGGARWNLQFNRPVQNSAKIIYDGQMSIEADMKALSPPAEPWVFVAHAPPHESKLDQSFGGQSYGSRSIREAIEVYQPMLSLHGHIHESPRVSGEWCEQIGRTLAVNPGQTTKLLSFALIEIDPAAKRIINREHGQQA
ncbi:MAG TPA: metallophosphoesterase [Phycisphaerae bacterium]|nr:metallophosphoesterase [Phycisphaerae bacterium]